MLIICNGAIKSGSTWLYNILVQLVDCEYPDASYLTGRSDKSPCIKPELLHDFLQNEDYQERNYISKNHLSSSNYRQIVASNDMVYVFDIERDPRDVVVSNYYHDSFRNDYEGSFEEYYWSRGRYVAAELSSYHDLWRNGSPRFYISSYEGLHQNFSDEVRKIAAIMGISPSDEFIDELRSRTSLTTLRREYKDDKRYQGKKFFRKGEVGDWKNHFNPKMLRDIQLMQEKGLSSLDRRAIAKRVTQKFKKILASKP